ncbi:hypothetical protein ILUMI_24230 [Ignelater luminosus]|uniref:Uncharacterized protein n=1 Tax=Ignelater luminosus TaxID=2038154 RepID=A0A8K0CCD2_IGNLU|nr:hypothetical protein ILUMI_24230 [Ignelater luminosus]
MEVDHAGFLCQQSVEVRFTTPAARSSASSHAPCIEEPAEIIIEPNPSNAAAETETSQNQDVAQAAQLNRSANRTRLHQWRRSGQRSILETNPVDEMMTTSPARLSRPLHLQDKKKKSLFNLQNQKKLKKYSVFVKFYNSKERPGLANATSANDMDIPSAVERHY